jgi:hypothetical protein
MDTTLDEESPRARLALLLECFSELDDDREARRASFFRSSRITKTKGSIKVRRKRAGWNLEFLLQVLQINN